MSEIWGLIFGRAYFWEGLLLEFYGNLINTGQANKKICHCHLTLICLFGLKVSIKF